MQRSLLTYAARRTLQAIPLVFVIIIVIFTIIHVAPGDPASYLAGVMEATPEFMEHLRAEFGLDRPLHEQLVTYIVKVLQGDLGYSLRYRQPVLDLILSRMPATFLLMGASLIFASIVAVLLGTLAATKHYSSLDNLVTPISIGAYSMPAFWLGMMLLIALSLHLGLFPSGGMTNVRVEITGLNAVLDIVHHLILPAITYSTHHLALMFRVTRARVLETLTEDFIITARAKGLPEKTVIYRHALRNALLPIVTVMGYNIGFLFAGSMLTETVFAWPGMGRLMYEAILARDYPVIMGGFMLISIMVIVANLIVDIIYVIIDPRVVYK